MWLEGDLEDDLFKLYPELNLIPEFKALKKEYGQQKASKLIWAIAKTEDPESKLFRSKKDRKRKLVEEQFLKEEIDWESDLMKDALRAYIRECMTVIRRFLKTWSDKILEADRWLAEQDVEKILSKKDYVNNFDNMIEQYEKYEEKYLEEKVQQTKKKGGYKPSRRQRRIQVEKE